jgi:hypothetical protein
MCLCTGVIEVGALDIMVRALTKHNKGEKKKIIKEKFVDCFFYLIFILN